jgi:hypothetical protein
MPVKSEDERAILYREQNDARIAFRMSQLERLQGSYDALVELWRNYRVIYDVTNYIEGQPDEDFLAIEDYYTDGQRDYDGNPSASAVRLKHARRPNR